ncbi:MAG TPA: selenium-dependent molybdenum cofactor biosynthesis protein YqeB [Ktedonobacterales bacterium]|nr:selenium-dependent molybdenum cofactor biosynthesis protein YqeB [Ktedonobacterales bacterium]
MQNDATPTNIHDTLVAVKGAGDLASGVIHRLARAGFAVMATELAEPTVVRRTVSFAEAIMQESMTVEGVTARRAASSDEIRTIIAQGMIPVAIDPDGVMLRTLHPTVLIEATISKHNTGVTMNDAPIVIALGPGYEAGKDVHAVIETNRGHNLGRVYLEGCAEANTGVPGAIGGYTSERLLKAPAAGTFYGTRQIGDLAQAGETVAMIRTNDGHDAPVMAAIRGIVRGLLRDGLHVSAGMKVGDIDPRAAHEHCFTISDKSRAVAGGALEAILYFRKTLLYAAHFSLS